MGRNKARHCRVLSAALASVAFFAFASQAQAQATSNGDGDGDHFWGAIPRLPLGDKLEDGIDFVTAHFGTQLSSVAGAVGELYTGMLDGLLAVPSPLVIAVLVGTIWRLAGRTAGLFAICALFLIISLELWSQTMSTFALMATAVIITLVIGIPTGIVMAQSSRVEAAVTPVLDFMQTMPPFVYLIPAVIMFGIGPVPGIVATVLYAMPVPIRLTNIGIRQVEPRTVEAGEAFGCSTVQLLFKIKLPLALPVIAAGVNQTIMYSLGMVIVASMIGAGGLGAEILRGITRLQFGVGFEAGLAVVLVAVLLDRLGQGVARTFEKKYRLRRSES